MLKSYFSSFIICFCCFSKVVLAQPGFDENLTPALQSVSISSPATALIDIEGGSSLSLAPNVPLNPGNPLDFTLSTNNTLWLNVSSVTGHVSKPRRTVSVAITSGTIPAGLGLRVVAANDAGQGGGRLGTPNGTITLTNTPQTLISEIGTCFTGDGVNKGHRLTYSLIQSGNYSLIKFNQTGVVTITYTLSD